MITGKKFQATILAPRAPRCSAKMRASGDEEYPQMAGATDARFAAGLIDQLAPLGAVHHRRFFSGQGIVCGEVQFAMILQGTLYLRVDAPLAARMQARGAQPFV